MRRIILALVISVAALSLAAYATRAVWSSSVTVTNNKIITGTANLQVSIDGGTTYSSQQSLPQEKALQNLIPGGQTSLPDIFFLSDEGGTAGVNFNISAQISSVTVTPGTNLDMSKLQLSIYETNPPSTASAESGPGSSGWFSVADWQSASRSLNSLLIQGRPNAKKYTLAVRLLSAADNTWQGQTVTIGWTVTGTQPAGAF